MHEHEENYYLRITEINYQFKEVWQHQLSLNICFELTATGVNL